MDKELRLKKILKRLENETNPVSATTLAKELGVSRQIIVQDIALLRMAGHDIQAMARGYIEKRPEVYERVFKAYHSDEDERKELYTIVDFGGIIKDVFVFHRAYGVVHANMNISSRVEVDTFLEEMSSGKSKTLKNVTSGYHYHTISAKNENTLDLIEEELGKLGFLAPLQEYEPEELKKNQ